MTRSLLLSVLLLASAAPHAQTFRPAGGPWTRAHELVGSTPDGRIFARVGPRLGVTRDGGRTWTVVSETAAPSRIAGSGSALYGAFPDGVRLSTDGGATWTPFGLDGQSISDVAVGETVYALAETAVYRLGDLAVWQPTTRPGEARGARLSRLDAAGGTVAVAAYEPSCGGSYIQAAFYRSRDAGATWTRSLGTGYPQDVAVAPDGTAYFATTTGGLCPPLGIVSPGGLFEQRPVDDATFQRGGGERGGVAIDAAGRPVSEPEVNDPGLLVSGIALSGSTILFGTRPVIDCGFDPPCAFVSSSGLYAARDGRNEPVGFDRPPVRALTIDAGAPVVPSDGAVYRLDSGRFAFAAPLGNVRAFVTLPWAPATTLALSGGAGIPTPPNLVTYPYNQPLMLPISGGPPPSLYLRIAATASATVSGNRVLTASLDLGRAGVLVTTENDSGSRTLAYRDIGSVGAVGGATVYAGAVDGIAQYGPAPAARIFRSDDRGDSWTPDDAGLTARNVYAFTTAGPLHLAGTNAGVFARTPGAPWQPAGLDGRRVLTFYDAPDGLLAGTDDGLFRRDAAGAWSRYGQGLDGRAVYAVLATTDAFGPWLGVGTDVGLFQTRAFGVAAEGAPAAAAALRVQTLPNPARGARTVRVSGAPAAVAVFDALGRVVADLGTVAGGDVRWDASGLPTGVYVVRATTEAGASASVRAVVLR